MYKINAFGLMTFLFDREWQLSDLDNDGQAASQLESVCCCLGHKYLLQQQSATLLIPPHPTQLYCTVNVLASPSLI